MAYSTRPKVVENRPRERARRWNLQLVRTREQYGPIARSYGLWDPDAEEWAFAGPLGYGKTLEECEEFLRRHANGAGGPDGTT